MPDPILGLAASTLVLALAAVPATREVPDDATEKPVIACSLSSPELRERIRRRFRGDIDRAAPQEVPEDLKEELRALGYLVD